MRVAQGLLDVCKRVQKLAAVTGALMVAAWLPSTALAQAQALPTLSCSTPNRINTGTDAAGALVGYNQADPYWQYTPVGSDEANTLVAKSAADWHPATVVVPSGAPWIWQTYPNANWIAVNSNREGYSRTYYRYRFNLDPSVAPADFGLGVHFHVDDLVLAVFVNGVKQDGVVIGGGWTTSVPHYTIPGEFSLSSGWQTGTNEIVVLVQNYSGATWTAPTPLGGLLVRGVSACGGGQITKQFAPNAVQPGGTSNLTITVTNRTDPQVAVSDVRFTDVLPAPLVLDGAPLSNTCGGTTTGASGDGTLALAGGTLPAGTGGTPGTCAVTVPVRWPASASAQCTGSAITNTITPGRAAAGGQFSTAAGQVSAPASASLVCTLPMASLQVTVSVAAGSVDLSGARVPFTATCQNPSQSYSGSVVLGAGNTASTALAVPAGSSNCTLAIGALPPAPSGFQWAAAGPAYAQPNPAAVAAGATVPGGIALALLAAPVAVPVGGGPAFWLTLTLLLGLGVWALRRWR